MQSSGSITQTMPFCHATLNEKVAYLKAKIEQPGQPVTSPAVDTWPYGHLTPLATLLTV